MLHDKMTDNMQLELINAAFYIYMYWKIILKNSILITLLLFLCVSLPNTLGMPIANISIYLEKKSFY